MAHQSRHPLSRAEVHALAENVTRWLELIERGELEAQPSMIRHLEGAREALRAVLGEPSGITLDSHSSFTVYSSHGQGQEALPRGSD